MVLMGGIIQTAMGAVCPQRASPFGAFSHHRDYRCTFLTGGRMPAKERLNPGDG